MLVLHSSLEEQACQINLNKITHEMYSSRLHSKTVALIWSPLKNFKLSNNNQ